MFDESPNSQPTRIVTGDSWPTMSEQSFPSGNQLQSANPSYSSHNTDHPAGDFSNSHQDFESTSSGITCRPVHTMTTRSQAGVHCPNPRHALQILATTSLPQSVKTTLE